MWNRLANAKSKGSYPNRWIRHFSQFSPKYINILINKARLCYYSFLHWPELVEIFPVSMCVVLLMLFKTSFTGLRINISFTNILNAVALWMDKRLLYASMYRVCQ